MSIREARPGDEAAIHAAHMRSIREICVRDHGVDEIRGWGYRELGNRWVESIRIGFVWVVEVSNVIQGVAYIRIFKEEQKASIHALYLTPEVLRQGYGEKLAKIMISKAVSFHVTEITLESTITAHDFYKRIGFVDDGPMKRVDIGGYPVTCFPMKMLLASNS